MQGDSGLPLPLERYRCLDSIIFITEVKYDLIYAADLRFATGGLPTGEKS
jgi:hypothetical protein